MANCLEYIENPSTSARILALLRNRRVGAAHLDMADAVAFQNAYALCNSLQFLRENKATLIECLSGFKDKQPLEHLIKLENQLSVVVHSEFPLLEPYIKP